MRAQARSNVMALVLGALPVAAAAQQPNPIPIRRVVVLAATDSGMIASPTVLRPLSNGSVLIVDQVLRQLLLIDSSFKRTTVIADAAGVSPNHFGGSGGLLPFDGDSTAFVDQEATALLVVSATGQIGRTMAPPNVEALRYFAGRDFGNPGFDTQGRLYYRTAGGLEMPFIDMRKLGARDTTISLADSVPLLRADLDARRVDTLALISIPAGKRRLVHENERVWNVNVINPLPAIDDWAFFPDGTVAIVRAHDYHVDWILPDGSKRSTPKMPFDWRAISAEQKTAIVDSVQRHLDSLHEASAARATAMRPGRSGGPPILVAPASKSVSPGELPDYYPPVIAGSRMRFDADGNLWVLPSTSSMAVGGLLYDVVNRKGEIIERVQMPPGCRLNGFGPGGVIYLLLLPTTGPNRIERAQIIR